jgi:hypothetical protein
MAKRVVVGFYRDHGKTKPITKSVAQLERKKVVKDSRKFKGVTTRVRNLSQALEDLMGELGLAQDHLLLTQQQQKEVAEQGKQSPVVDAEIQKTSAQIRLLKNKIRELRSYGSHNAGRVNV